MHRHRRGHDIIEHLSAPLRLNPLQPTGSIIIDHSDDIPSNPRAHSAETITDLINARWSRRRFCGTTLAGGLALSGCAAPDGAKTADMPFGFREISRGSSTTHQTPDGYTAQVLLRWGDALFADAPAFDAHRQSARAQLRQFGYNNDFIGYVPLPPGPDEQARALLCVNHEFTNTELMFPGVSRRQPDTLTREHFAIEMAAHGGSIVEIVQRDGAWSPVVGSAFNRRITANSTPMRLTGPAAGHPRLRTTADPRGLTVAGTMNNCAGGITPWGTYLMAEENFHGYFLGAMAGDHPEARNYRRYGVPGGWYSWGREFPRFDIGKEPNEPNRFGWVVEVDIMNPASIPKKRTALGRMKHEGAESVIAPNGRVVFYMGDDQQFDYVYKFVTNREFEPENRDANTDMLDDGILYVARFEASGVVRWLPLVYGEGPLTAENQFASQADVLIETRRAADLLGATPMDRPEDVEPDPGTGRVWVMLTNNTARTRSQIDAANPRANNLFGHIIEIQEPAGDFTATLSRWEILVRCGDPDDTAAGASWSPLTSDNGWFGSPDNAAVDPSGRLWVATDGNPYTGAADGLWALSTDGPSRGAGRAFFRAPVGAEVCGPRFSSDGGTLFLAVQHPGASDGATFAHPTTRWPDFKDDQPPRPAVLAIRRKNGGLIGA